ncbi:uncharacterized protein LOC133518810 [Cydia pomonella]|uniref:uncharacterized protein LOC133518810 n=1 Tax=Cydia pomonella TaxID=82600 RepID=UPI002ADD6D9B|nr:uncharacterized protein LOC133518810 [Cydia pomonella]
MYKSHELSSEVGCQQGDPLGPAIFSLAINPIIKNLKSKFNVWYLDDGTLGGDVNTVLSDLSFVRSSFENIGLDLNFCKCELFIYKSSCTLTDLKPKFDDLAPNIKLVDKDSLCLLGSPVFEESFPDYVSNSISKFKSHTNSLLEISPHYALVILKFCLFFPKFTYVLRCCPFWEHQNLLSPIDDLIKISLETILNIQLSEPSWSQASLPIRFGGLGIRKISSVASPAFLTSINSTSGLIGNILRALPKNYEITGFEDAKNAFKIACPGKQFPDNPKSQRSWDNIYCDLTYNTLLNNCTGPDHARLLAVGSKKVPVLGEGWACSQ